MRRRSFLAKLFVGNLALVSVILVVNAIVANSSLRGSVLRIQQQDMLRAASIARAHLQAHWRSFPGRAELDNYCKHQLAPLLEDMRVTIIANDPPGTVLGDTSEMPARQMVPHNTEDRPEIQAALQGRDGFGRRPSETIGTEMLYVAQPVTIDADQDGRQEIVAVVRVAMPLQVLGESQRFVHRALLAGAVSSIVSAGVLGLLLSWVWFQPLRMLARAARRVAGGDLDRRIRVWGSRELEELAEAINEMRESLAGQIRLIDRQRTNLDALVESLQEGLILVDTDEKVILVNAAARQLLEADPEEVVGRNVQMLIRNAELMEVYRRVRKSGEPAVYPLRLDGDGRDLFMEAFVAPVLQEGSSIGHLIVLQDVTAAAETNSMRSDFIASASHELRTPVATLRAAVDSLLEIEPGDEATVASATKILDRQVARLEDLTTDLLDFHATEDRRYSVRAEPVAIASLRDWARRQYGRRAEEKGVRLVVSADPAEAVVPSDRRLIESILGNLIDNAIKFTPAEGTVEAKLFVSGGMLNMIVSDSGVGISPGDQRRVFERFYQADPSRSGDTRQRGSGLGLAIVKHAALRLNGEVHLESAVGEGTTFTVEIPLPNQPN